MTSGQVILGRGAGIDFVGISTSCDAVVNSCGTELDFGTPNNGHHHVPTAVRFFLHGSNLRQPPSKRFAEYDRHGCKDEQKVMCFKVALGQFHFLVANVEPSTHEYLVNEHVRSVALQAFGLALIQPRQAYLTSETPGKIRPRRKNLRRFGSFSRKVAQDSSGLRWCLLAWKRGRSPWRFHVVFGYSPFRSCVCWRTSRPEVYGSRGLVEAAIYNDYLAYTEKLKNSNNSNHSCLVAPLYLGWQRHPDHVTFMRIRNHGGAFRKGLQCQGRYVGLGVESISQGSWVIVHFQLELLA